MTRILVVDDVKLFRHMESSLLQGRGYSVTEASGGAEALESMRENPPDLVLLDYYMPGMTGTEVCTQIKKDPALQSVPVVIVTSSSRDEDIRKAVQAGCDDYLTKPIDDVSLLRKVEDLLGSNSIRRFPRLSASLQVSFEDFRGIFFEYAKDISRNGVFIEMANPVPVGTKLRLSFSLPKPFDQPVMAYGRVVRISKGDGDQPGGVGVSFMHVPESSAKLIDALVAEQDIESASNDGVFSRLSYQVDDSDTPDDTDVSRLKGLAVEYDEFQDRIKSLEQEHIKLSAMVALADGLLTASTVEDLLVSASDVLKNLIGASSFCIMLKNTGSDQLRPIVSEGLDSDKEHWIPLDGPILQAMAENRIIMPVPPLSLGDDLLLLAVGGLQWDDLLGVVTIHALFPHKSELAMVDLILLEMFCKHLAHRLVFTAALEQVAPVTVDDIFATLD